MKTMSRLALAVLAALTRRVAAFRFTSRASAMPSRPRARLFPRGRKDWPPSSPTKRTWTALTTKTPAM